MELLRDGGSEGWTCRGMEVPGDGGAEGCRYSPDMLGRREPAGQGSLRGSHLSRRLTCGRGGR